MSNSKKAGRPVKEKDPKAKQFNVMIQGSVQDNESFKEKTRFMSFSQYVNSLIAQDLGI